MALTKKSIKRGRAAETAETTETDGQENRSVRQKLNDGAPRGRGRPRKSDANSSGTVPAAKSEAAAVAESEPEVEPEQVAQPAKRRGRPPLPDSERKTPVKPPKVPGRGRGRPRLSSAERKPKVPGGPRGRPRIPGGPTDQKEAKAKAASPKRRGRPPKATTERESETKKSNAKADSKGGQTNGKPRGRPPKAKQPAAEESDEDDSVVHGKPSTQEQQAFPKDISGAYVTVERDLFPTIWADSSPADQKLAIHHQGNVILGEFDFGTAKGVFKSTTFSEKEVRLICRIADTSTWDVQSKESSGALNYVKDDEERELLQISLHNVLGHNIIYRAARSEDLETEQNEQHFILKWEHLQQGAKPE